MNKPTGFTLIELMITLVLVAILATIGVPNFMNLIANNRLTTQANELVSSLNLARSEAIKRNTRVTVCRSDTGTSCSGTWSNGWIVFVDTGAAGSVDAGDEILRVRNGVTNGMSLTAGAVNAVQFQALGLSTQTDFTLSVTNCSGDNKRLINVATSGRVSTTKGACP
jgi:type IV fimbrial biogenesis protein FimT